MHNWVVCAYYAHNANYAKITHKLHTIGTNYAQITHKLRTNYAQITQKLHTNYANYA